MQSGAGHSRTSGVAGTRLHACASPALRSSMLQLAQITGRQGPSRGVHSWRLAPEQQLGRHAPKAGAKALMRPGLSDRRPCLLQVLMSGNQTPISIDVTAAAMDAGPEVGALRSWRALLFRCPVASGACCAGHGQPLHVCHPSHLLRHPHAHGACTCCCSLGWL